MSKFEQNSGKIVQIWTKLFKFGQNCSNLNKILDKFPDKILDKLPDNGKFDANLLSCNSALYIAISVAGSNRFGLVYIYIYIYIYICGSRKIIRYNGTIEKSAARTPGLTRAHKVYGAVGWV